jgi:hypothetical protein
MLLYYFIDYLYAVDIILMRLIFCHAFHLLMVFVIIFS